MPSALNWIVNSIIEPFYTSGFTNSVELIPNFTVFDLSSQAFQAWFVSTLTFSIHHQWEILLTLGNAFFANRPFSFGVCIIVFFPLCLTQSSIDALSQQIKCLFAKENWRRWARQSQSIAKNCILQQVAIRESSATHKLAQQRSEARNVLACHVAIVFNFWKESLPIGLVV